MNRRLSPLLALAIALASGLAARPACADDADPPPSPLPPPLTAARRTLNIGASLIPGLVLHGAGQVAAGQWQSGLGLLGMELAGVGVGAAGALAFWYSGASRQLVGTATALTLLGVSALGVSFLADLYGVLAPPGGTGAPSLSRPLLETSVGVRYVHDPRFAYRVLGGASLDLAWRSLSLSASAWTALDSQNQRLRAVAGYRLVGPRPRRRDGAGQAEAQDGSFLELQAAATHHAFEAAGFGLTLGEGFLLGRLDLRRIGPLLDGSFAELGLGWAMGAYTYTHAPSDATTLVLMRTAFGVYIGSPGRPHGEVAAFMEHRHDDYAGGYLMRGVVSGVFGHLGLSGTCYLTDQWGLAAEAQMGSAALVGLSLHYRVPGGGSR